VPPRPALLLLRRQICTFIDDDGDSETEPAQEDLTHPAAMLAAVGVGADKPLSRRRLSR